MAVVEEIGGGVEETGEGVVDEISEVGQIRANGKKRL